ncbi:unnamed protein product [Lactuca saligna]|uniref:Uncharacterized protein n=1 Tax=Lactuca saligna TaxID=75948 RepID=A0AA35ZTM4_LACSI|nr:unnamed protein product [Lactuca saligna]
MCIILDAWEETGLVIEEDLEVEMEAGIVEDIVVETENYMVEGSVDIEGNKVVMWVYYPNKALNAYSRCTDIVASVMGASGMG